MTERKRISLMLPILEEPIEEATQGTRYDVPWIMALVNRECGWKFAREVEKGKDPREVLENMKGDYGQRPGESKPQWHGYSPFQIDKDTAPQFGRILINKGEWTDLFKAAKVAVAVLEEKRAYLDAQGFTEAKLGTHLYNRAITAAYNCFVGSTKISLLDGTERALDSLKEGEEFYVYSCVDGEIKPAKAVSLGITGRAKKLVKITLDNGEEITCTPEHLFMNRGGEYIEATKLKAGDSLMPLYRTLSSKGDGDNMSGYEKVKDNASGQWVYTHRLVVNQREKVKGKMVAHHVDFNKRNNNPDNLEMMSWGDHGRLHAKHAGETIVKESRSEAGRKRRSEVLKKMWKEDDSFKNKRREGVKQSDALKVSNTNRIVKLNKTPLMRERSRAKMNAIRGRHDNYAQEILSRKVNKILSKAQEGQVELNETNFNLANATIYPNGGGIRWDSYQKYNHKVAKVEVIELESEVPVYDINVPETNNFALTAGVFVHNCGQGNVAKCLRAGADVDARTYGKDYSQDVFRVIPIVHELMKGGRADAIDGEDIESEKEAKPAEISEGDCNAV